MYGTILVPTDGSDHAARAAERAVHLAAAFDATVHLLHVVDLDAEAGPFSAGGVGEEYIDRLTTAGEDIVEETAAGLDADFETAVVTGRPAKAILSYADEEGADLIVMGTAGRTGVQRYVMGSVAERVVSLADVPVMTVTATEEEQPDEGFDEVLIPTDGSDAAAAAIEHGLAVADRFDAQVHAVNVVQIGAVAVGPDVSPSPELVSALESAGQTATGQVAERAIEADLDVVTEVRQGPPAEALLEYADEAGIDLIAMGTTGRTGLSRYLLGSTTERVIRHASMPVLAVNAREADED